MAGTCQHAYCCYIQSFIIVCGWALFGNRAQWRGAIHKTLNPKPRTMAWCHRFQQKLERPANVQRQSVRFKDIMSGQPQMLSAVPSTAPDVPLDNLSVAMLAFAPTNLIRRWCLFPFPVATCHTFQCPPSHFVQIPASFME